MLCGPEMGPGPNHLMFCIPFALPRETSVKGKNFKPMIVSGFNPSCRWSFRMAACFRWLWPENDSFWEVLSFVRLREKIRCFPITSRCVDFLKYCVNWCIFPLYNIMPPGSLVPLHRDIWDIDRWVNDSGLIGMQILFRSVGHHRLLLDFLELTAAHSLGKF